MGGDIPCVPLILPGHSSSHKMCVRRAPRFHPLAMHWCLYDARPEMTFDSRALQGQALARPGVTGHDLVDQWCRVSCQKNLFYFTKALSPVVIFVSSTTVSMLFFFRQGGKF